MEHDEAEVVCSTVTSLSDKLDVKAAALTIQAKKDAITEGTN